MLFIIEKQRVTQRFIRSCSKPTYKSGMKYIEIPKGHSIDWNDIPKQESLEYWKRVTISAKIEQYIIERTRSHLNQAHGNQCTILPLAPLLEIDNFTQFVNQIWKIPQILTKHIIHLQKLFFHE